MTTKTWAVFSDAANSTVRHRDNLTEEEAQQLATNLSKSGLLYYAAPSDFDPYDFGTVPDDYEEQMRALEAEQQEDDNANS